ncbi:MAG TPA: FixH family protein [Gemmatimonadaceae bacterium]|nr:FixH family protein [Gemmatimonadaceae bacterium]
MKKGTIWPIAVVAVLGTCVGANLWLLRLSASDPAFAVEENYYERAVNFDRDLARRRHLEESGWHAVPSIDSVRSDSAILVSLTLRRHQYAVDGAEVRVHAAHVARPRTPIVASLQPAGRGRYETWLRGTGRGLWDLRFDISVDTLRFSTSERFEVGQAWR